MLEYKDLAVPTLTAIHNSSEACQQHWRVSAFLRRSIAAEHSGQKATFLPGFYGLKRWNKAPRGGSSTKQTSTFFPFSAQRPRRPGPQRGEAHTHKFLGRSTPTPRQRARDQSALVMLIN